MNKLILAGLSLSAFSKHGKLLIAGLQLSTPKRNFSALYPLPLRPAESIDTELGRPRFFGRVRGPARSGTRGIGSVLLLGPGLSSAASGNLRSRRYCCFTEGRLPDHMPSCRNCGHPQADGKAVLRRLPPCPGTGFKRHVPPWFRDLHGE